MPRPLFEADLLAPGAHHSRINGVLNAPPERLRRYVDQFQRMKRAGIKIPLYWGHQMTPERYGPDRQPDPLPDDKATEKARWKAGHLKDLCLDPATGKLRIVATCPPGMGIDPETRELVDPVKHTCIDEVSAGIGDWQDGAGRWWNDAVVHVALTPLPAWVWQSGFSPVGADGLYALGDGRTRLRFVLGGSMATPNKPEDDEDDTLPGAGADDEAAPPAEGEVPPEGEGEAPAPADGEMPPAEGEAPPAEGEQPDPMADAEVPAEGEPEPGDMPGEEGEGGGKPAESPVVRAAAMIGINVPEGTTSADIEQVMVGIFTGLASADARVTVGGEHEIHPGGEKPTTEPPPMFFLSAGEPTPTGMSDREWVVTQKLATNEQENRRGRIETLRAAGVKGAVCDRLREEATRFTLSADGAVAFPDVDKEIALLEEVVADLAASRTQAEGVLTAALSTADPAAKAPENPARGGDPDPTDDEYVAWRDQQAERIYGPGVKAATPRVMRP